MYFRVSTIIVLIALIDVASAHLFKKDGRREEHCEGYRDEHHGRERHDSHHRDELQKQSGEEKPDILRDIITLPFRVVGGVSRGIEMAIDPKKGRSPKQNGNGYGQQKDGRHGHQQRGQNGEQNSDQQNGHHHRHHGQGHNDQQQAQPEPQQDQQVPGVQEPSCQYGQ